MTSSDKKTSIELVEHYRDVQAPPYLASKIIAHTKTTRKSSHWILVSAGTLAGLSFIALILIQSLNSGNVRNPMIASSMPSLSTIANYKIEKPSALSTSMIKSPTSLRPPLPTKPAPLKPTNPTTINDNDAQFIRHEEKKDV